MNKAQVIRIISIALPILCLASAGWAVIFQVRRMAVLREELGVTERNIKAEDMLSKELIVAPPNTRVPAVAPSVLEQPEFLNYLRVVAHATNVRLVKWSNTPVVQTTNADGKPVDPNSVLPPGVAAIQSSIEIGGSFNNIRQFLYFVSKSRRLLNVTDLKWSRLADKWPQTSASFSLIRYVSDAAPPGTQPQPNIGAAAKAS